MENKLLEWQTKEFEHYDRQPGWYLTLWIIAILLIGYELIMKDWFGAFTFLVFAVGIYFFAKLSPKEITVVITDKAIEADRARFTYPNIKNFWMSDFNGMHSLHFETTAYLNRFITILLGDQNPEEVRQVLSKFLPEIPEQHEGLARRLSRHLKF